MGERTTVTQVVQFGVETTPGTSVAANRSLPSFMLNTSIEGDFTEMTANGVKFPTGYAPGKEWSSAKVSGQPTYDELLYPLVSILKSVSGVQVSSTTAYTWTMSPDSDGPDTIRTFTVEEGSAERAHKFLFGVFDELTLKGDRSKVELSASMLGRAVADGITLTSSPTVIAQVPILPKHISIYSDDTSGGLGTTKLTRVLSWEFALKNRFGPLWVVDAAQASWVEIVEQMIDCTVKLRVEADAEGMGFLTEMRAGTKQFLRINAESNVLAGTAVPYELIIDACGVISEPPGEIGDTDGVYAIDLTFKAVHDATWAKALDVVLTNRRSAL